jgi:hypothetical protein
MFSFAFLLSACKNEDIVTPIPQKQLSKIIQDADNYSTFDYLSGKLIIFQTITESEIFASVILNYDGNNLPQSEFYKTINEDVLKKYYYNESSLLDSMDYFRKDNSINYTIAGHMKYYFNESNLLSKIEQYNLANDLAFTTYYDYDASGNIIDRRFYYSDVLNEITTMTYDNKINPWYGLKEWLNYEASISKNNLLSSSTVYPNNSQNNSETMFTYNYDSDGYPISSVMEYTSSSNNIIINNTYEYK